MFTCCETSLWSYSWFLRFYNDLFLFFKGKKSWGSLATTPLRDEWMMIQKQNVRISILDTKGTSLPAVEAIKGKAKDARVNKDHHVNKDLHEQFSSTTKYKSISYLLSFCCRSLSRCNIPSFNGGKKAILIILFFFILNIWHIHIIKLILFHYYPPWHYPCLGHQSDNLGRN